VRAEGPRYASIPQGKSMFTRGKAKKISRQGKEDSSFLLNIACNRKKEKCLYK